MDRSDNRTAQKPKAREARLAAALRANLRRRKTGPVPPDRPAEPPVSPAEDPD